MRALVIISLMLLFSWPPPMNSQEVITARRRVVGSVCSYSTTFPYTGSLNASWSGATTAFIGLNPGLQYDRTATSATYTAWWNGCTFANDQYDCTTVLTINTSVNNFIMPAVRMTGATSGYISYANTGNFYIYNASGTSLVSVAGTPIAGHEYCLYVVGTALTLEDKTASTTLLTTTDSSYASGSPGINVFNDTAPVPNTISNSRGGPGVP